MITLSALVAAGIGPTQARLFAGPLQAACDRFGISNLPQVAAFVAQLAHESGRFATLEESLYYRTPARIRQMWPTRVRDDASAAALCRNPQGLANLVYANRNGNGPPASGDGWRYRGRGLIQITGRANYAGAAAALQMPYVEQPELLLQPDHAALSAGWFWAAAGCNDPAGASDIDGVTRRINPAMAGAADRRELFREALDALRA